MTLTKGTWWKCIYFSVKLHTKFPLYQQMLMEAYTNTFKRQKKKKNTLLTYTHSPQKKKRGGERGVNHLLYCIKYYHAKVVPLWTWASWAIFSWWSKLATTEQWPPGVPVQGGPTKWNNLCYKLPTTSTHFQALCSSALMRKALKEKYNIKSFVS